MTMAGPLSGRVAVVSGGGRGLGRAFCLALARQGASVVVNNRNRVVDGDGLGSADHVAAEIAALGGSAFAEYSDAASPSAGNLMVGAALERWGRLERSKGAAYADYMSRTSGFFPWPPRRPGLPPHADGTRQDYSYKSD